MQGPGPAGLGQRAATARGQGPATGIIIVRAPPMLPSHISEYGINNTVVLARAYRSEGVQYEHTVNIDFFRLSYNISHIRYIIISYIILYLSLIHI